MAGRTFAIGDIHGDFDQLLKLLNLLPPLDAMDTLVFLGDYVDRGPRSAQVIRFVRDALPQQTSAKIVTLRGSHEDAWLKVRKGGYPEFILPVNNGCLATLRSFRGGSVPTLEETGTSEELMTMLTGSFWPDDVVAWMEQLLVYYEDDHALYVHAGLPKVGDRWAHPSELSDPKPVIWQRTDEFFRNYRGKLVVFGHTPVKDLPHELSIYTPDDPSDLYVTSCLVGADTGCGHSGFLSAIELPNMYVYESRRMLRTP
jgi:serine/threonine protein phosphatase 1